MSEQTMKDSRTDVNNNSDIPTNKKNWFERNPKKTIFFVILLGILILPFVLEGVAYFLVDKTKKEQMRKVLQEIHSKDIDIKDIKIQVYKNSGYKDYETIMKLL